MNFGRIAVIYGGQSAEAEISRQTGQAVIKALQELGLDAVPVDIGKEYMQQLVSGKFARAFIASHGQDGENGIIQGVLEALQIPYTGSKLMASALAMDKVYSKMIWQQLGISTPDFKLIDGDQTDIKLPAVIKPVNQGSSLGISIVKEGDDLKMAVANAFKYDHRVISENYIAGPEYTMGIVGDMAFPSILIETQTGFYDYDAKYVSNDTRLSIPSGLTADKEQELQELSWRAYKALGCTGWGRVDVMQDLTGKFWVLEINTVPGLTSHSLVPLAAAYMGLSFNQLVLKILETSL